MDTQNNAVQQDAVMQDYNDQFVPAVHRWGRSSMVIAAILSFLPIAYMYFVLGWKASGEAYASVFTAIGAFGIGMWLTEPLSYFPILGSAGTYMSYFAGNVGNMRSPVAMSVQSLFETDISTPKGQIVTILAIGISVFVNLIILLAIVLSGSWIISVLPKPVIASMAYVMPSLLGCMLMMRIQKNMKDAAFYLMFAVAAYYGCSMFPAVKTFGMAIAVGICVLGAFGMHKAKTGKDA